MKPAIVLFFTQHTVSNNKKGQWHTYMLQKDRYVDTTVTSKLHQRLWGVERRVAHVKRTDGSACALRYPTSFFEIIHLKSFHNMTAASATRGNSTSTTWQQKNHPNSPFPPSPLEVLSTLKYSTREQQEIWEGNIHCQEFTWKKVNWKHFFFGERLSTAGVGTVCPCQRGLFPMPSDRTREVRSGQRTHNVNITSKTWHCQAGLFPSPTYLRFSQY